MRPMDHDYRKENWLRGNNKTPGCTCPPWRYTPRHPKPTNPGCPTHGQPQETEKQAA